MILGGRGGFEAIIKWLERPEWRVWRQRVLDLHVMETVVGRGYAPDEVVDRLGSETLAVLSAFALEDLCTWDCGGGPGELVDDILKRRGWKLKAPVKRYLSSLSSSMMGLYEVDEVSEDSLVLEDMIRGNGSITVTVDGNVAGLEAGDVLAARVLDTKGKATLGVGALVMSPDATEDLLNLIEDPELFRETLRDILGENEAVDGIRDGRLNAVDWNAASVEDLLPLAACLFSHYWIDDLFGGQEGDDLEDADDGVLTTLSYSFDPKNTRAIMDRLSRSDYLTSALDDDESWLCWSEPEDERDDDSDWDTEDGALLGSLSIEEDRLVLLIPRESAVELGDGIMRDLLGDLIGEPEIVREGMGGIADDLLNSLLENPVKNLALLADILGENVMEIPLEPLGHRSLSEAAATEDGKLMVAAFLKEAETMEQNELSRRTTAVAVAANDDDDHGSLLGPIDITWIWEELGILHLRGTN